MSVGASCHTGNTRPVGRRLHRHKPLTSDTTMPHEYTDLNKHTWDVELTLDGSERIDSEDYSLIYSKPFSILAPNQEIWNRLAVDRRLIMAMIYAMIRPQVYEHPHYIKLANAYDANPKDYLGYENRDDFIQSNFRKAINGQVIDDACEAFWGSLAAFFPKQEKVILKYRDIQREGMELVNAEVEEMLEQDAIPILKASLKDGRKRFTNDIKEKFKDIIGSSLPELEGSLDGLDGTGEP